MIFSRWRPATGGYDYFADSRQHPLGNDLPVPALREMARIGAPSTDVGRTGAPTKYIGSGPFAKGMILPTRINGLGASADTLSLSPSVALVGAIAGIGLLVIAALRRDDEDAEDDHPVYSVPGVEWKMLSKRRKRSRKR